MTFSDAEVRLGPGLGHRHHFLYCLHCIVTHSKTSQCGPHSGTTQLCSHTSHPSQDAFEQVDQSPTCSSVAFGRTSGSPSCPQCTPSVKGSEPLLKYLQETVPWRVFIDQCSVFLTVKTRAWGARIPGPSPHSGSDPSRAQDVLSEQEPQALLPQDTRSHQGLCL